MTSELASSHLQCGSRLLDLSCTHVMGILNMTPDSFSDGGVYTSIDKALRHIECMVLSGASIIDIGGESTRPGAKEINEMQELERIASLIQRVVSTFDVVVSVDTSSALVIKEATNLGVGLINDVRALQAPGALRAAIDSELPVCLMHMQGLPKNMQAKPSYSDVLQSVAHFLKERIAVCTAEGLLLERIIIDPGFGFGKELDHNLTLLKNLSFFQSIGRPLLVGLSRKSMVGQILDKSVNSRIMGSVALALIAAQKGARILRVHDVSETVDAIRILEAVNAAN